MAYWFGEFWRDSTLPTDSYLYQFRSYLTGYAPPYLGDPLNNDDLPGSDNEDALSVDENGYGGFDVQTQNEDAQPPPKALGKDVNEAVIRREFDAVEKTDNTTEDQTPASDTEEEQLQSAKVEDDNGLQDMEEGNNTTARSVGQRTSGAGSDADDEFFNGPEENGDATKKEKKPKSNWIGKWSKKEKAPPQNYDVTVLPFTGIQPDNQNSSEAKAVEDKPKAESLKLNLFYLYNQIQILFILVPIGFPTLWSGALSWLRDIILLDLSAVLILYPDGLAITNTTVDHDVGTAVGLNLACTLIVVVVFLFVIHRIHTLVCVTYENEKLIWNSARFTLWGSCVLFSILCFLFVPTIAGAIIFGSIFAIYPVYAVAVGFYINYIEGQPPKVPPVVNATAITGVRATQLSLRVYEMTLMQALMIFVFPAMLIRSLSFFTETFPDGGQVIRAVVSITFVIILVVVIILTILYELPVGKDKEDVNVSDAYLTGVFDGDDIYYMLYLLAEKAFLISVVAFATSKTTSSFIVLVFLVLMLLFTLYKPNIDGSESLSWVQGAEVARLDVVGRVCILFLILFALLYGALDPAATAQTGFVDVICLVITSFWIVYAAYTIWKVY